MANQVFISWSREAAKIKGGALRDLLRYVVPDAQVFMSDQDIRAGSLWLDTINSALENSVAGVVIVTQENTLNPWLHFEAGSLSTRVSTRMVIPLLAGVDTKTITDTPLSAFQAKSLTKENVLIVCKLFANALQINRREEDINHAFEKFWPDYENDLLSSPSKITDKKPIDLEQVMSVIDKLHSYARSQSDALAELLNRKGIADAIVGQGPFATMSTKDAKIALRDLAMPSPQSIKEKYVIDMVREMEANTVFRIMIKGESWIGQKNFGSKPVNGQIFDMNGTKLSIESIQYDPINDPDTPDMLIIAKRV